MFTCLRYYEEILLECQMGFGAQESLTVPIPNSGTSLQNLLTGTEDPICHVDGSWSSDALAGIGAYVSVNGRVVQWCSQRVQAMNSVQAEAMAVVIGYKMLMSYQAPKCLLYSDSMEMVDSLAHKQPRVHDWRMFTEVWTAWQLQHTSGSKLKMEFSSREDPGIQNAHLLANLGRIRGWDRKEQNVNLSMEEFDLAVRNEML